MAAIRRAAVRCISPLTPLHLTEEQDKDKEGMAGRREKSVMAEESEGVREGGGYNGRVSPGLTPRRQ